MIDSMVVICNFQLLASISPIICSYAVSAEDTDISRLLSIHIQDSYSLRMHKAPHFIFLHTHVSHVELDIRDKTHQSCTHLLILLPAFIVAFLWWLSSNTYCHYYVLVDQCLICAITDTHLSPSYDTSQSGMMSYEYEGISWSMLPDEEASSTSPFPSLTTFDPHKVIFKPHQSRTRLLC